MFFYLKYGHPVDVLKIASIINNIAVYRSIRVGIGHLKGLVVCSRVCDLLAIRLQMLLTGKDLGTRVR